MKILIVQTAFLGDIVLSTPVIAAVQKLHPQAEIYFLTTPLGKELLKNDTRLTEVLVFDKRKTHSGIRGMQAMAQQLKSFEFACVYSLHKSWRTSLLLWLAGIPRRIGFTSAGFSFLYTETKTRIQNQHDVLRNLSLIRSIDRDSYQDSEFPIKLYPPQKLSVTLSADEQLPARYVVVAPGSVWRTKRWSATRFRQLVSQCKSLGRVVLVGSQAERALCAYIAAETDAINLAGSVSLNDLLLVVEKSSGVVCNDSVVLHIASAFKRPVVAMFCATSPDFGFGPWQTEHEILQSQVLACRPCRSHGSNVCPTGTERCRTDIQSEQVIGALRRLKCFNQ